MLREYSFKGRTSSQARPTTMHRADRYGGILRMRASLRSANIVAFCVSSAADVMDTGGVQTHISGPFQCPSPRAVVDVAALRRRARSRSLALPARTLGPQTFAISNRVAGNADATSPRPPPAAMPSFPQFNPLRIRSYIFRLPLATRLLVVAIVALWAAAIPFPWLRGWASLEPDKMDLTQSTCYGFHMGRSSGVYEKTAANERRLFESRGLFQSSRVASDDANLGLPATRAHDLMMGSPQLTRYIQCIV